MTKTPYYIGKIQFKTIKECQQYARDKIGTTPRTIERDDPNFPFFEDLINNHSEYERKIGVGIDSFKFIKNPMNKNAMHGIIIRIDETEEDYSWLHCCRNNKTLKIVDNSLISAMRYAIKEDTIKFKQQQAILKCNICNAIDLPNSEYHTDHINPSFREIKDNFLILHPTTPTIFSRCMTTKMNIFSVSDNSFELKWFKYHRQNANYQILCKHCNLKKH